MKTTVVIEDSKYGKLIGVYTVLGETAGGELIRGEKAIVKFGLKKGNAICNNIEAIKECVEKLENLKEL